MTRKALRTYLFLLLLLHLVPCIHAATVLETIKAAGSLRCGVDKEEDDYTHFDMHGNRAAFDLDICKAVAVASLGPGAKFLITAFPDEASGLKALQEGKIDLLATATPSLGNAALPGVAFGPVVFYDTQGFLVPRSAGITDAKGLAGKKVCFISQTENEEHLKAYGLRQNIKYVPFPFQEQGEMEAAFATGNCTAITSDITQLANTRARFHARAKDYILLPDRVAKDPLAPALNRADQQWSNIVTWTIEALIQAEESGITQTNVPSSKASVDPVVMRLLGTDRGVGAAFGLDNEWALHVIQSVGNYGEIFNRDLGSASPLNLPRDLNELWTNGGLIYSLPLRID